MMRKLIMLLMFLILIYSTVYPTSATFDSENWTYHKTMTINQTMVNQNIYEDIFPMYINITDVDLASKAQADGDDIVFTNSANNIQLAHQIVGTFNSTTGYLQARVNVTDISNVSYINMHYNNSGATNTENPSGVWGVNASGIWLMDEGTGLYTNDSSGNNNNGTINGSDWVLGGLNFVSANNDYINCGNDDSLNITNAITVRVRIKRTGTQSDWAKIVDKHVSAGGGYYLQFRDSGNNVAFSFRGSDSNIHTTNEILLSDGILTDIVSTFNGTSLNIFKNGVASSPVSFTGTIVQCVRDLAIGSTSIQQFFNGTIYSVYIYNYAQSIEEIATQYNNTNSPELFISVGAEQTISPNITSYTTTDFSEYENVPFQLNATADQTGNWTLYADGGLVQTNTSVLTISYINSTALEGLHNYTAIISNVNGNDSVQWNVTMLSNSWDSYVNFENDTYINFTLSNYTAGLQGFNIIWGNRTGTTGNTSTLYYQNGTSITSNSTYVDGNTTLIPEFLIPEGTYYIEETTTTTIETFVVVAGAFAAVVFAGAAVVSRRVRRGIGGFWNRRTRRR